MGFGVLNWLSGVVGALFLLVVAFGLVALFNQGAFGGSQDMRLAIGAPAVLTGLLGILFAGMVRPLYSIEKSVFEIKQIAEGKRPPSP